MKVSHSSRSTTQKILHLQGFVWYTELIKFKLGDLENYKTKYSKDR